MNDFTRWNFEVICDKIHACRDLHEKGQPCEYEELSPQEILSVIEGANSSVRQLQARLNEYGMSAGCAHQMRAESKAARVALGFDANSEEISPRELRLSIEQLQARINGLEQELATEKECHKTTYSLMKSGEQRGVQKASEELQPKIDALTAHVERLRDAGNEVYAELQQWALSETHKETEKVFKLWRTARTESPTTNLAERVKQGDV